MVKKLKQWRLRIGYRRVNGDVLDLGYDDESDEKDHFAETAEALAEFAEKHFKKWQRSTILRFHKWNDNRYDANHLNYTYPIYVIDKVKD